MTPILNEHLNPIKLRNNPNILQNFTRFMHSCPPDRPISILIIYTWTKQLYCKKTELATWISDLQWNGSFAGNETHILNLQFVVKCDHLNES